MCVVVRRTPRNASRPQMPELGSGSRSGHISLRPVNLSASGRRLYSSRMHPLRRALIPRPVRKPGGPKDRHPLRPLRDWPSSRKVSARKPAPRAPHLARRRRFFPNHGAGRSRGCTPHVAQPEYSNVLSKTKASQPSAHSKPLDLPPAFTRARHVGLKNSPPFPPEMPPWTRRLRLARGRPIRSAHRQQAERVPWPTEEWEDTARRSRRRWPRAGGRPQDRRAAKKPTPAWGERRWCDLSTNPPPRKP